MHVTLHTNDVVDAHQALALATEHGFPVVQSDFAAHPRWIFGWLLATRDIAAESRCWHAWLIRRTVEAADQFRRMRL